MVYYKARGASHVIRKLFEQNDKIYIDGYKNKENLRHKEEDLESLQISEINN